MTDCGADFVGVLRRHRTQWHHGNLPPRVVRAPRSVGRAIASILHMCDESGADVPTGEEGMVYFEQPKRSFEYHNAPDKTASATHPIHDNWTSLGDVGYVDEEGFLYLTDRKAYMIISGGVNIYPQEIEDALVLHPAVQDVAVFGVPNADFGEEVKAVVELAPGQQPSDAVTDDLMAYAKEHLAGYKVPDYRLHRCAAAPPTGKLYKRLLKDQYCRPRARHGNWVKLGSDAVLR